MKKNEGRKSRDIVPLMLCFVKKHHILLILESKKSFSTNMKRPRTGSEFSCVPGQMLNTFSHRRDQTLKIVAFKRQIRTILSCQRLIFVNQGTPPYFYFTYFFRVNVSLIANFFFENFLE
jgi:hypothetical protein